MALSNVDECHSYEDDTYPKPLVPLQTIMRKEPCKQDGDGTEGEASTLTIETCTVV